MPRSPLGLAAVLALGGAATALVTASPAAAGLSPTYLVVTTTADTHDLVPGDLRCDDGTGECSLRAAFEEAEAQINEDTIDLPPGRYVLDPVLGPLAHGGPGPLLLQGGGDGSGPSIVDGGGRVGPLLDLDLTSIGSVRLRQVTLTGSPTNAVDATSSSGASLHLERVTVSDNIQGLRTSAPTTITSSRIEGNGSVRDHQHAGGGVEIDGAELTMRDSVVVGNHGTTVGGIAVQGSGRLDLVNSTVTGNTAVGTDVAGAIDVDASASARLRFATVVDDDRAIESAGTTTVESSVVVGACTGDGLHGLGASVVTDAACLGEPSSSDAVVADALLAPLDLTGDPHLPVHPLREGSPAVDRDEDCSAGGETFATDQRGAPRPEGPACDAGAAEGVLLEEAGPGVTQDVVVEVVGELSIAVTQGTVAFDPIEGGATATAAVGGIVATNTLTSGPSWGVTVAATSLSNGVDVLPSTVLTFLPGSDVTAAEGAIGLPVPGPGGSFDGGTPWSAALTVLQGDGPVRGTFTLGGSTLAIAAPPVTPSGTYAGTLQYTILG